MKNKTHPKDSAFPVGINTPGLSKREYFAALAMQGFCSSQVARRNLAREAVRYADLLIAALNEEV